MDADAQLMLEFQQGDRRAFEALFRRHAKAMVNFAYRYVDSRAAAEELAQDIFCKVFEASGSYAPSAKFTTWLYRVATNHCLNEVRKGRYQVREVSFETGGKSEGGEARPLELPHNGPGPHAQAEQMEFERALQVSMKGLPANQRLAMALLVEGGQSYDDIARDLNTSVGAVKSLLVRARTALKGALKDYLDEEP